jgi:hypothetical protein
MGGLGKKVKTLFRPELLSAEEKDFSEYII